MNMEVLLQPIEKQQPNAFQPNEEPNAVFHFKVRGTSEKWGSMKIAWK